MTAYLILATGALATFGLRITMTLSDGRLSGSDRLERSLRFIAPAVLAAIVVSGLFINAGSFAVPNVIVTSAVVAGAMVARRTGNAAAALAAGLPIYWIGALAGLV